MEVHAGAEAENGVFDDFQVVANPDILDQDSFATIWNVASSTMGGDLTKTRELASKFLNFLCKNRFEFIVASNTDLEYLDDWFQRDNKVLYDWTAESEMIDVVAQHANVPFEAFVNFLAAYGFDPESEYKPKRADRVEWFQSEWNVG